MAWSVNNPIPRQLSKASPALGRYVGLSESRLHMVHVGDESNQLWHSIFDDSTGTWYRLGLRANEGNSPIPGQLSKAAPALSFAAPGDMAAAGLHMVHLGDESNRIWHSIFDGETWPGPIPGSRETPRSPGSSAGQRQRSALSTTVSGA